MRIDTLEIIAYRAPFERPEGNGVTLWTERRAALVRLTTPDGFVGLGEAWAPANAIEPVLAHLAALAPRLMGGALADAVATAATMEAPADWIAASAGSAIDMACADAMARGAGEPLWRFCGGRAQVDVYASGGLYAPHKDRAALAAELAGYVAVGFTTVKMKVGTLTLDDDLLRVASARRAIGDATLVVDALSRLARDDALDAVRRFADSGAMAVQAPITSDDVDGLAALAQASPVALWVGEADHDVGLFERLARLPRPPWLQLNPALAGGTRVSALAERLGGRTHVTLQCHATAVLQAASLHLAGSADAIAHAEFHMFHRHLHDLLPASARLVRGGRVTLGDEPGLGFDLPREDPRLGLVARFNA